MKTAYTILALTIISLVVAMSGTDHGSKQAFTNSIRAASQLAQK